MRTTRIRALPLILTATAVVALTACERGDVEGTDPEAAGETALPGGLDPALALSPDPVDQMNYMLGMAVRMVPGGQYEVRYRVSYSGGDSVFIDYQQHRLGEFPWPPAPARGVALLSEVDAVVAEGRGVDLACDVMTQCVEYQAFVDSLDFVRLPEGQEGDWFRTLVRELAAGETSVADAGGEAEVNRRLKEDTRQHYSETVSTWYQVHFDGAWMQVETWQQTQGFPENMLPGTLRVHLPWLEERAPGVFGCAETPCVLDVQRAPFHVVLESAEDAERFVELFNGLGTGG